MPAISIVDPALRKAKVLSELSIQLSPNGFSFCVFSTEHHLKAFRYYSLKNVVLFNDLLTQTEEIIKEDYLLKIPANNTRVMHAGRNSIILPNDFADPEWLKKMLNFNHPVDELDEIHINKIRGHEISLVFAIHHYVTNLFTKYFKNTSFINQAVPLLYHALNREKRQAEVFIQLNKDFFDIVILQYGELKLYNSFLYVNSTDLVYFILYVCKQLKIDTKKTPFNFIGDFSENITLFFELSSYLPNSTKIHAKEITQQAKLFNKLDTSRFFSLLNLHRCGL